MSSPALKVGYQSVKVADIVIPEGHRATDPERVKSLAESIKEIGLLQPIVITPDNHLISGGHRLAAFELLGHKEIPAIVQDAEKLLNELATIDENLVRCALSDADEFRALARRKEIYETLHPETKAGASQAAGCNRAQGKHVSDKSSPTFTEDTAKKTGMSRRSIERKTKIGEKLSHKAVENLHGTSVVNNSSELAALSELPAEEQEAVADGIKKGAISSVRGNPPASREPEAATQGLAALKRLTAALKACGILEEHRANLANVRQDLEKAAGKMGKPAKSKTVPAKPPKRSAQPEKAAAENAADAKAPEAKPEDPFGRFTAESPGEVTLRGKTYSVKRESGMWFYRLSPEAGWAQASPGTVKEIERQLSAPPTAADGLPAVSQPQKRNQPGTAAVRAAAERAMAARGPAVSG